jgi:hypothetical protein
MQDYWPLGPIDIPDIMAGLTPERPFVVPHLWIDPIIETDEPIDIALNELQDGVIRLEKLENEDIKESNEFAGVSAEKLDLFSFTGSSSALYEFRSSSVYCIPVYPDGSKYFDEFGDFVSDVWFPKLSGKLNFIGGRDGIRTGVISHAANLKPQPIPAPENRDDLGFENGLLVTLLFGAVPNDFPIWLEATRDIIENHKNEDNWELSYYDAIEWLRELALYIGWPEWPNKKYIDL